MRYLLVGTLALLVFTPAAFGHGSSYSGPRGEMPPGMPPPGPPGPPPPWADASSPGTWEWWWSLNKEEFLYPEATRERKDGEPGSLEASIFVALEKALRDKMTCPARSRVALAAGAVAASRGGAPESLLDRLRELSLDRKQQRVVQACTAVALGMAGQRDEAVVTALSGTALDGKAADSVRGAAALAIGLLGVSRSTGGQQGHLAWSTLETAAASGSADLRACALIAAGLDGSPERIPILLEALGSGNGTAGTSPAPGDPASFTDKTLSLAVTGLGKFADLGSPQHAPEVVKVLQRFASGSTTHSRRAAIAALGRWGSIPLDERLAGRVLSTLLRALGSDDALTARTALLSLAQMGGSTPHESVRTEIAAQLVRALTKPGGEVAPYAALSLGILARSPALCREAKADVAGKLRGELRRLYELTLGSGAPPGATPSTPTPPPPGSVTPVPVAPSAPDAPTVSAPTRDRAGGPTPPPSVTPAAAASRKVDRVSPGAYALALGLIGDEAAAPLLIAVLADGAAHSRLRGYAAVALGMLGSKPGIEEIRSTVKGTRDADLLVLASIGAGLAGDGELLPTLLARTSDGKLTIRARTMAIRAVGKLGDRSAIPELLKIVGNRDASDVLRSTAAIAIADLFDKDGALVLTRLTRDLGAYAKNNTFDLILSVF